MEIVFGQKYLEDLYLKGKAEDKKHRFQPQIINKYRKVIDLLESLPRVEDLYRYNSLNYEVLKGDKSNRESVRVNDQYRIEMRTSVSDSVSEIIICSILELSNHYK